MSSVACNGASVAHPCPPTRTRTRTRVLQGSLTIVQNKITAFWFKDHELALAFGFTMSLSRLGKKKRQRRQHFGPFCARFSASPHTRRVLCSTWYSRWLCADWCLRIRCCVQIGASGSVLNFNLSPTFADQYGLVWTLWAGCGLTLIGFVSAITVSWLDKAGATQIAAGHKLKDAEAGIKEDKTPMKISDIFKYPATFWFLLFSLYGATSTCMLHPFSRFYEPCMCPHSVA